MWQESLFEFCYVPETFFLVFVLFPPLDDLVGLVMSCLAEFIYVVSSCWCRCCFIFISIVHTYLYIYLLVPLFFSATRSLSSSSQTLMETSKADIGSVYHDRQIKMFFLFFFCFWYHFFLLLLLLGFNSYFCFRINL